MANGAIFRPPWPSSSPLCPPCPPPYVGGDEAKGGDGALATQSRDMLRCRRRVDGRGDSEEGRPWGRAREEGWRGETEQGEPNKGAVFRHCCFTAGGGAAAGVHLLTTRYAFKFVRCAEGDGAGGSGREQREVTSHHS